VADGDRRLLPVAVLLASFVMQAHLTYVCPSILLLVVAVAGGWLVSGTKLWTSHAHRCHWMLTLVRTAPGRHDGLTQLLIPLDSPGIAVRPVTLMTGEHHFNEVVFEDALAGVQAGRAGRFGFVVGVDRVGQAEALREHGADVVVKDLAELLETR